MATATKTKSKTKLVPLGDRLVIKPVVQEEVLASGIVIPDKVREGVICGTVIAAGPDAKNVLPGDIAVFETKYAREIEKDIFSIDATGVLALKRE